MNTCWTDHRPLALLVKEEQRLAKRKLRLVTLLLVLALSACLWLSLTHPARRAKTAITEVSRFTTEEYKTLILSWIPPLGFTKTIRPLAGLKKKGE